MAKRNQRSVTNSIFTRIHKDREGVETPIVSMGAEHLVAYLNFMLIRNRDSAVSNVKMQFLGDVAPENMPEAQRISLGLKKVTPEMLARAEAAIEEAQQGYMAEMMDHVWPYIVVGICRDDTRDGVVKVLQQATGVTGQIALPHLTGKTFRPMLVSGVNSFFDISEEEMDDFLNNDDEERWATVSGL